MKIKEIIENIHKVTNWVDYDYTRDQILIGDENNEVTNIGVCWVATLDVLKQAKQQNINFIISHENPLYIEGTAIAASILAKRKQKQDFCKQNNITIYRLHDGWDQFPEYGVCDQLAKTINLPFESRDIKSLYQKAILNGEYTVEQIAKKVAQGLAPYGSDHVEVLGDLNAEVNILAMGVGAATDTQVMNRMNADCMIVSYDGTCGWIDQQWAIDSNISLIMVHHYTNEIPGIIGMQEYFKKEYPKLNVTYLKENYKYSMIK